MTAAYVRVLGTTVRLRGDRRVLDEMTRLWEPFAVASGPADAAEVLVTDPATASAMLNRHVVSTCPHPAVHAGVVSLAGRGVAVPAASGQGKSTLVAALCRRGATYLSDEALVVGADGWALPYPKPLALTPESLAVLGLGDAAGAPPAAVGTPEEHLLSPRALGPVATSPTPVGDVVLPVRDGECAPARVERVPRREALRRLVELGFNHYRDPPGFLRAMAAVVGSSRVWTARYREAPDAATALMGVLPGHVSPAGDRRPGEEGPRRRAAR